MHTVQQRNSEKKKDKRGVGRREKKEHRIREKKNKTQKNKEKKSSRQRGGGGAVDPQGCVCGNKQRPATSQRRYNNKRTRGKEFNSALTVTPGAGA